MPGSHPLCLLSSQPIHILNAAEDIRLYLKSRHGVVVPEEEVEARMVSGLGGGSHQNGTIDMMELVALLLIPTLIKASNDVKSTRHQQLLRTKTLESSRAAAQRKNTLDEIGEHQAAEPDEKESAADELIEAPHDLIETVLNVILYDVSQLCEPRDHA